MEIIRCGNCNRKLAEATYFCLKIKCPRCGTLNQLKAPSFLPECQRASYGEENGPFQTNSSSFIPCN
ncbi:Com family DNA-binding transcriptional regulator [Oxalobacter paraformigenes]|nr:Com family DNA-binding transcriptional regulator [Oxalobacter paraformigenes]